ncbi:MAG TPA: tetratricopeptide repeat protein [Myxococcaceae bacterium]|nr:tetratricopeptide repeat protein [Myxococcaceae bacterium]
MRSGISAQAKDGVQLLELGLLRDASRAFASGLKENPDDLECLLGLSRTLLALGNEASAAPLLLRYLRLKPNHPEVVSHLAKMKAERGDAKALETLEILSKHPDAQYHEHSNYGAVLLKLGRLDEAEQAYERALESDPDSPYARVALGMIAQRRGDPAAAIEHFQEASAEEVRNPYPLLQIGRALVTQKDFKGAIEAFNEGLRRDPKFRELHVERIKVCIAVGSTDAALKAALHFRQFFPKDAEAAHLHGLAALTAGQGDLAKSALEDAMRLAPQAFEPRMLLARLEQATGNTEREQALLEEARKVAPNALPPLLDLSNLFLRIGRVEEAVKLLQDGLKKAPQHAGLHLNLALALAKTDPKTALEHARAANAAEQQDVREQAERLVKQLSA